MGNSGQGDFGLSALIAAAGTIGALIGLIISLFMTRFGQKQNVQLAKAEADRAQAAQAAGEASAKRAENAAGLTIDVMERIADALDKVAGQGIRGDVLLAKALPERVSWSLDHHGGDEYILTNTGEATAYNVQLSAHESLMRKDEWASEPKLRRGHVMQFMAARSMGTSDSTITVEWSTELDGEKDVWRYPLPARPPR
jgi:hypothetical protein